MYPTPMKMEAVCSSETSVSTVATRHHIQEDNIFHCYRRENIPEDIILRFCIITRCLEVRKLADRCAESDLIVSYVDGISDPL